MSPLRKIITIDEEKCTGCGECIPGCPEGALQIIDEKARLISDLFCDGLGACIGDCPEDAISIEEREAEPYDEDAVMANIVKSGPNTIAAHLKHLSDHGATEFLAQAMAYLERHGIAAPKTATPTQAPACGCASANKPAALAVADAPTDPSSRPSRLGNWPIQISLVPPFAPFLKDADLLVAADCVPAALAGFHEDLLDGRVLLIGCPKFDDIDAYRQKLTDIFQQNEIRSVMCAYMVVPCCLGLPNMIREAIEASGKDIPYEQRIVDFRR
jgi:Pyruvate/2-oxoacid:ferredoxin oxidoreductase delta subunit